MSRASIDNLIFELNNAIDLKLDGKDVSEDNFKTANGFYLTTFNKFEYKYFPSKTQKPILNVIKSFQYIGNVICNFNLSDNELRYIKNVLSRIWEYDSKQQFKDVVIDTKEMYLVLLNLEIIAYEIKNKDVVNDTSLPDKKTVLQLIIPLIKRQFSFKSAKFTFAFKMAFIMFVWQILTLLFNLPFTKWLYFATIPLMLPYINDLADTARTRLKGTFIGVFIFLILIIVMEYIPISFYALMMIVIIVGMIIMVLKLEDKLILASVTTVMSIMAALIYIEPPEAMVLKLLWVTVAVCVVTLFNFKFLPYSVEKETKDNLTACFRLNKKSIDLVKLRCIGEDAGEKTTVLVVSNVLRENIEVTDENKELYDLQMKITDICNFILNYLEVYGVSDSLKNNLINIIDKDYDIDKTLDVKDKIISYSMKHVMNLYKKEANVFKN